MKVLRQRERGPWRRKLARRLRVGRDGSPAPLPPARKSSRVLVVSQVTVDGVAVCVRDLVQAAVDAGYQVTVAAPRVVSCRPGSGNGVPPGSGWRCGVPRTPATSWR